MVKASSLELLKHLRNELKDQFVHEADSLAMILTEHYSGLDRTQIIADTRFIAGHTFNAQIETAVKRIKDQEPIQYVLGRAHFYGREFKVDRSTLIPRPETEELVHHVIEHSKGINEPRILDIGTGTGCIPISLALELPNSKVYAIDISSDAIQVAEENARIHQADVSFEQKDIINDDLDKQFDIIISNPPYVLESEKLQMKPNVLEHEPERALFVPDSNPLLFYKRIAGLASSHLIDKGILFFEINERFGSSIKEMLEKMKFEEVEVIKDLQGKDRIVRAHRA